MIKRVIAITLFILIILTPNIVIASDYVRCTIPKGTKGYSLSGGVLRSIVAFEDQVFNLKKDETGLLGTFSVKGFINNCYIHGREIINSKVSGVVWLEDLENCVEYDEES